MARHNTEKNKTVDAFKIEVTSLKVCAYIYVSAYYTLYKSKTFNSCY